MPKAFSEIVKFRLAQNLPYWQCQPPKGVVTRDKFDATRCSILFVNLLGAKKVSVGTCVEIGWADANDVPIVLVMEKGNIHEHAFITESASFVTDNINDAINIVRAILADY